METQSVPFAIRRTKLRGKPAELLTFTGTTEDEYDTFLDARFAEGREAVGFRQDAGAPTMKLMDSGRFVWCQFRRLVQE